MWVCFVLPRCNILVWWDWNIFIWLKGKCCILRQARTPCRFQLNPLESRDTVEFCAIQLAMLGLLRRVSCSMPSVQCLASVKCQGCRHRAYKLQTETNKTLQYWLSTAYLQPVQPVYRPYLPISTKSLAPCTGYWAASSLLHSSWVWRLLTIEWLRWWAWNQPDTHFKLVYNTIQDCEHNHWRSHSLIVQRLIIS